MVSLEAGYEVEPKQQSPSACRGIVGVRKCVLDLEPLLSCGTKTSG
jgi:hypothetical protein